MRHQGLFNDKFDLKQMPYLNKAHTGTQSPLALFLLTELMALIFATESVSQHRQVFMLLSSSELSVSCFTLLLQTTLHRLLSNNDRKK